MNDAVTDTVETRSKPALDLAHRVVAGLIAVTIVVLALIAGQSIFAGRWDILIHGYIGNAVFVLALLNGGLAFVRRQGVVVALAIGLLVFAQIGLGYVGRDTPDATAWHIPNGVLLMGLATFQYARAFGVAPAARA